jgi:hypothetical protein
MVKNDWTKSKTNKELEIMNTNATTTNLLSTICIRMGQCSGLLYLFSYLYLQIVISKDVRILYLESYVPYDYKKSPSYEITVFCQCISCFIAVASFIGIESYFIVIVMHLCCKLNILRSCIECLKLEDWNFKKNKNYIYIKKEISGVIKQHNELYRFCQILFI